MGPPDVVNLIYFVVGLAIGLLGLLQNQKYFQAQQQDKFNHISSELTVLREATTKLAEQVSEHNYAREERLFTLALPSAASKGLQTVSQKASQEAVADIGDIVRQELQRAGVSDAIQRTARLEAQVSQIVTKSTERVVKASEASRSVPFPPDLWAKLAPIFADLAGVNVELDDLERRIKRSLGKFVTVKGSRYDRATMTGYILQFMSDERLLDHLPDGKCRISAQLSGMLPAAPSQVSFADAPDGQGRGL